MFKRNCPICGKEQSYTRKGHLERAIQNGRPCRSCSNKGNKNCAGRNISEETRRKLSKAHTGKTLSEEHRRKMSIAHGGDGVLDKDKFNYGKLVKWSKNVRKRDQCCQKCNSTENLEAHHIINKAIMPELAYEEWNGITLCKPCHTYFHHQFLQDQ